MRTFTLNAVALATLALCATAAQAQSTTQSTTELQKVIVTGQGDKLGTGLIVDEDAPKSRSSVTKAQLEKTRSSGNPFQALTLLPGVNSSSYDATGLFGGNLRVRGFNSDQMGFTVNGAPVNDSGNFAVFPQEYIDQEDLCSLYVTQGAADTDAPHVGASGGNVGIISCAPEDVQRARVAVSLGQLSFYRTYARFDTGKVGNWKAFLSVSKSAADKWKGPGKAQREHLDSAVEYALAGDNKLSASFLYNHAVNNNFLSLPTTYYPGGALAATAPTFANSGYYADFGTTIPKHVTPVNGTKQTDTGPNPAYYGYSLNPFNDALLTGKASLALSDRLHLDVQPYFWYGYGTGGTQQTSLQESSGSNQLHGGIADINKDGDALDSVLVYRGSLTKTMRPGITTTLTYTLDNQKINGGVWYERAHHRQTAPATVIDNNGGIGGLWLDNGLLAYGDGTDYNNRNWLTISTGESVWLQDTVDLLDNKLQITPSISYRRINRKFNNYANSGAGGAQDYNISQSYSKPLPSLSLSFQVIPQVQVFSSIQRSFRVPSNFEFGNLGRGTLTIVNGVGTYASIGNLGVVPETSTNFDLGTRYKGGMFTASVTGFYNRFQNRISSSFNPIDQSTQDTNVGASTTKGLEFEVGTVPVAGFSGYLSATYTKSTIKDNLLKGPISATNPCSSAVSGITYTCDATNVYYNTAGAQFPDTPKGMLAASVQWANGPYLVNIDAKYTGRRFLTLSNDIQIAGFTTVDANLAWKLPDSPGGNFKNPTIRINVSNLLNKKYYLANSGSGSSVTNDRTGNPSVYGGSPRFTSATFQVDY